MNGILLMSIDSMPLGPQLPEPALVSTVRYRHIEGQPVFVSTIPRDCCGISRQAFLVSAIKLFLKRVRSTGRRYPRVEPLGLRHVE